MARKTIEAALRLFSEKYFKDHLSNDKVYDFGIKLGDFIVRINKVIDNNENEEHFKNITNEFLKVNFFSDIHYQINTDKYIDSTIKHDDKLHHLIEMRIAITFLIMKKYKIFSI